MCGAALMCGVAVAGTAAPARAGTYKQLCAFPAYGNNRAYPKGSLTMVGGILYGVTWAGGGSPNCEGLPDGCGTV